MADLYFELEDAAIPFYGRKYFTTGSSDQGHSTGLLLNSKRVWMEQGKSVWYVKYEDTNPYREPTTVDLKEFMWIKLKAEVVSG